ncbi:LuxR C-terminal-related transcriptional regulator [Actinomadura sp. 21ATH]|uniref:LuxR C-terminal-related transcriptional regulator n=1 Tax=Actinomadura sp. 21ATH TaxID=1735444 RepID=UPI0035C0526C
MRTSWPFTGRTSTLDEMGALLSAREARGVVVAGDAGVGKTRLAGEALRRLEPARFTVLRLGGSTAEAAIPFGAFGHVLAVEALDLAVNPMRRAAEAVRALAGGRPLLVAVDDAHLLDPASAALVHHLVLQRDARVLATVRAGEPAPDPVTALWKDDLARRLDLVPLTLAESQAVVEAALGGQLAESTARRLHHSTRGNLLFLRELVQAGLDQGRLEAAGGVWRWHGDLPLSPRLRGLVEERLGTLAAAERDVLEYAALGEPLGAATLAALTSEEAIERAEARHLVTSAAAGHRLEVRPAHPLYGEVARQRADPARIRDRKAALASAVEATGMRRHGDVLKVALWRLDAGVPADPGLLLAGCRQAWSLHDIDLAVRCAEAVLAAGADPAVTVLVAPVLLMAGRHRQAEERLARVADAPMDEATRASHAAVRAFNLGMGLGEPDRADALLAEGLARTAAAEHRQEIIAYRSLARVYSARFGEAEREEAAAGGEPVQRAAQLIAAGRALRLMLTGAYGEAVALSNAMLREPSALLREMPTLVAAFGDARAGASLFAGYLDAADAFIAYGEALFTEEHLSPVAATTCRSLRVEYCLLRGDLRGAVRWAHEAAAHGSGAIRAISGHGYELLAYAAAVAGDAATAATAMREAMRRRTPAGRIFHFRADLARAWIRAAAGDHAGAAGLALDLAPGYRERSLRAYEMFALHDAVRLGAAGRARDGLERLAGETGGRLAGLFARHAAAAAAGDGAGLDAAALAFADLGMPLYGAEAAAAAAAAHGRAGRAREANAAATRARALAARCAGARTPALAGLAAPGLTARQLEIARLAAEGLGNREIADRLVLSVRTVANHLHAVYDRLGVTDRDGLAELLPGRPR